MLSGSRFSWEVSRLLQAPPVVPALCWLVAVVTASFVLTIWVKCRRIITMIDKLPGPPANLLTGNLFSHVNMYKNRGDQHHTFLLNTACGLAHIHHQDGICRLWAGPHPIVLLFNAKMVEDLITSNKTKKPTEYQMLYAWLKTGLLIGSGVKWKRWRKMLNPAFHTDVLKRFMDVFNDQSMVLVETLRKRVGTGDWVDVVPLATNCALDIVCEATMGIRIDAQRNKNSAYTSALKEIKDAFMERGLRPWLWPDWLYFLIPSGRHFLRNIQTAQTLTKQLVKEKKENYKKGGTSASNGLHTSTSPVKYHRQAFMDLLIHYLMTDPSVTEQDVCEQVDTLLFAGHDTSAAASSWTLYNIGRYPEVQKAIHEELDAIFGTDSKRPITTDDLKQMKYLESVIKESLRLFPPVPVYGRMLLEDVKLGNYTIPRGTACYIFAYMLHRDPDVFPNPEKFLPSRFLGENLPNMYSFIPFSIGPRSCIGQKFAMMEEKTVVANVLRAFQLESLDPLDKIDVEIKIVLVSREGLRIRMTPRKS